MFEISSGELKAVLAPSLGGVVISLAHGGRDLLRRSPSPAAVAADPREAACYPCVPWFSRLPDGLDFGGRHYDLAATLPACDPDHALHGHGWVSPWMVSEQASDRLVCRLDYAPKPHGFPFAFSAVQEFTVARDAFRIDLTLTNSGPAPMPAGLGLHPFFPRQKDSAISFEGAHIAVADRPLDDSFPGWGGKAAIRQNERTVEIGGNAPILHLYAPQEERFFCAEPVTHLPGDFGGTVLMRGENLNIFLTIAPT